MPSTEPVRTFVEVVRRQSLSAAARALGLPKSTVSRRLFRLEQQLHTQLLQRNPRKVLLTAAGRRFYESVFQAVDALELAVQGLAQSSSEPRGSIRLTAPADFGRMVLSSMLVAFLERYPEITLDLVFTNRFVDLVQEGMDLAVRAGRVVEPDLFARKLCTSELQLAASAARRGRDDDARDVRTLEREPFVLYRAEGAVQTIRLERAVGKRRQIAELKVTGRINVDDYAALADLVAAGQGLGLMPSLHLQEGALAGRLVRLFPEWSSRSSHVYLVSPTRQQPERVRLLSAFLLEAFAALPSV